MNIILIALAKMLRKILAIVVCTGVLVSFSLLVNSTTNDFGYNLFIVQSDSMKATDFAAGDVVIAKHVDPFTLKEGDIITFLSESFDTYGEVVTHKIREVKYLDDGSPAFVTYGTTTNTDDEALATIVIGQYVGHIPYLGTFYSYLMTVPGRLIRR